MQRMRHGDDRCDAWGGDATMHLQKVVVVVGRWERRCGGGGGGRMWLRQNKAVHDAARRGAGRNDGRLPENRWTSAKNRPSRVARRCRGFPAPGRARLDPAQRRTRGQFSFSWSRRGRARTQRHPCPPGVGRGEGVEAREEEGDVTTTTATATGDGGSARTYWNGFLGAIHRAALPVVLVVAVAVGYRRLLPFVVRIVCCRKTIGKASGTSHDYAGDGRVGEAHLSYHAGGAPNRPP